MLCETMKTRKTHAEHTVKLMKLRNEKFFDLLWMNPVD